MAAKGVENTRRNNLGQNAVHSATIANRPDIVKFLLAQDLHCIRDNRGMYPLHYAVMKSGADLAKIFMNGDENKSINLQSVQGYTPLHYACVKGEKQTVYMLI